MFVFTKGQYIILEIEMNRSELRWKPQTIDQKWASYTFGSSTEHSFHSAFAVDASHLRKNQWEVHTALTGVVTAVNFVVGWPGQIRK